MENIDPKFLTSEYLATIKLRCGGGSGQEGDCCALQERRRWSGLDPSSYDVPSTDSQVCGRFMTRFQDGIKDDAVRNRLVPPLMVKLVGSAGSAELERLRLWISVDCAIREIAPLYFDIEPELAEHAASLRSLAPIVDSETLRPAERVRGLASHAAWSLRKVRIAKFREAFRAEYAKRKPSDPADAAAEAVAVVAVVAEEAVVAVVAAVADAAEAAEADDRYWEIRLAVRGALIKHFRENMSERLKAAQLAGWELGAKCLERMLDAKEAA